MPPKKEYYKKCFKAIESLYSRMEQFAAIKLKEDESEEEEEETMVSNHTVLRHQRALLWYRIP